MRNPWYTKVTFDLGVSLCCHKPEHFKVWVYEKRVYPIFKAQLFLSNCDLRWYVVFSNIFCFVHSLLGRITHLWQEPNYFDETMRSCVEIQFFWMDGREARDLQMENYLWCYNKSVLSLPHICATEVLTHHKLFVNKILNGCQCPWWFILSKKEYKMLGSVIIS